MYCVWQVVKTPTIISNNPVYPISRATKDFGYLTLFWCVRDVCVCVLRCQLLTLQSEPVYNEHEYNEVTNITSRLYLWAKCMSIYLEILHESIKHASRIYRANFACSALSYPRGTDPSTFNSCGAQWKADYQSMLITQRIQCDTNLMF